MYANHQEAIKFLQGIKGLRTGHLRLGAYAPYHVTDTTRLER